MGEARPIGASFARIGVVAQSRADSRHKLIGAIRAAAKRKGLDDDTRRDVIEQVTGKRSCADCDAGELGRVLDMLNKGWRGPAGHRAHLGKARALWWALYWLGEVDCELGAVEKALDTFVQRQTGIATLAFLDHRKAPAVIEALKSWCERAGVDWALPEREAVVVAIWAKLRAARAVRTPEWAEYIRSATHNTTPPDQWSPQLWDAGIRLLGKLNRKAMWLAKRKEQRA